MPQTNAEAEVVAQLRQTPYAVIDQFLPQEIIGALYTDWRARLARDEAKGAGVGRASAHRVAPTVRGDRICWFDPEQLTPAQDTYWQALERLRQALNAAFFLGLQDCEAHYAHYPPGAYYARHRDAFNEHNRRSISTTLYLNVDWSSRDGGALRLHPQGTAAYDILPQANRLVVFDSRNLEHEVLPTVRDRYSVAAWLRVRPL